MQQRELTLSSCSCVLQGWQWLDEGKTRQQHKWGYISLDPGAQLDIQVLQRRQADEQSHNADQHIVLPTSARTHSQKRGSWFICLCLSWVGSDCHR